MNNDYILERKGKIKEIWAEKLRPQLSQLSDLDKEVFIEVQYKFFSQLPDDFDKLQSIYSLMNDIQAILVGERRPIYPTIEENLRQILKIQ